MTKQLQKKSELPSKRKYNWIDLKKEFFLSNFLDVEPFLRDKGMLREGQRPSNNTATQTKGWGEAKRKWLENQFEIIRQKAEKKLQPILGQLIDGKKVVLFRILGLLQKGGKEAKDYKTMWEMIKTELGETTRITENHNDNRNTNFEVVEALQALKNIADDEKSEQS